MNWETIHTTDTIDGYTIRLSITPDWDAPDAEDPFIARVEATREGITLAEEFLGGCQYPDPLEFLSSGYYEDLAEAALRDARAFMRRG